jgi:NAD(P)-dependent dehydrogenase (short-subunit alcohol dehydrogenase family)
LIHPRIKQTRHGVSFAIDAGEIGRTAAFLASPACGYVAGTVLDVDGGGMFR